MVFHSRSNRKSSPDPESRQGVDHDVSNANGSSISGHNSQKRRRPRAVPPSPRANRSSLPLHHIHHNNTCNNFLLGGHYYPGKDKKSQHRRTLWYRIFCSSTPRKILSVIVVSYLLLWHVLVPGFVLILEYGKLFAANNQEDLILVDVENTEGMNGLTDIDVQKKVWDKVKRIKDKSAEGGNNQKLKILEKLVPKWYHRNDNTGYEDSRNEHHSTNDSNDDTQKSEQHDGNKETEEKFQLNQREESVEDTNETPSTAPQSNHLEEPQQVEHFEPKEEKHEIIQEQIENDKENQNAATMKEEVVNESQSGANGNSGVETPPTIIKYDESEQRTLQNIDVSSNKSQCPQSVSSINTTIVVQCSLDRLWILHETCRRWHQPIVTVVHITENNETTNVLGERQKYWQDLCPQMRIIFHQAKNGSKIWEYPVNRLRNIGLDAVQTSHVLVMDVDFVPSLGLDVSIQHELMERNLQFEHNDQIPSSIAIPERYLDAIVIPAFERVAKDDCVTTDCHKMLLEHGNTFLPENKKALTSCVSSKNCTVFQLENNWEGHWSTHSDEWLGGKVYENTKLTIKENSEETSRIIRRIRCFDSLRYEPYVVVQWCPASTVSDGSAKPSAPYYDERFYGYGKNKIQLISHLRFLGYQFSVLPNGFLVHQPHPESNAKKIWNNVEEFKMHEEMDKLYTEYLKELTEKYAKSLQDKGMPFVAACKN